jgi:nitroimidazol reductase NimA-like FMN-containing flavoprotein (pyridoxamine 5'-phosphate oxidase superfamily)/osmotically-inducible protein OsmY
MLLSSVPAAAVPLFKTLSRDECESVLLRNNVGRIAFALHDRVSILPVHFVFLNGWVYGRTASAGKLRQILRNRRVAFEVDEHSQLFDWRSVVVHGPFYLIQADANRRARSVYLTAVAAIRQLVPTALTDTDPVPFRDELFRIRAAEITGRASVPSGGQRLFAADNGTIPETAEADDDARLRDEVQSAIDLMVVPDKADIHIETFDGVVVLSGTVGTPGDRHEIETEVLKIPAVVGVVQELETSFPIRQEQFPAELARAAIRALESDGDPITDPASHIPSAKVVIDHGWLRLEGIVQSQQQRDDAIRRLRTVRGSRGVIDRTHIAKVV